MKTLYVILLCIISPILVNAQDIFEIKFNTGVTQYRGALALWNDGTGKLRIKYYSNGKTVIVEQYIKKENTRLGIRLTGYNPVYPGTSIKYPGYSADNFYISQDEYGEYSLTNVDDAGVVASCYIRQIKEYYAKQNFLSDFNWKIE